MKLFVGLGNPGAEYAFNRHNVGFMAVDAIASEHGFPAWRKRFSGLTAEGKLGREQVLLLKPQTYMNESGRAAGEAARFYKLDPADVIVFHDELDLVPGKVRVKAGGGSAGHNGLRSLTAHLGNDYVRVRIGIGHPGSKDLVKNWVLQNFVKSDREWLEPLLGAIAKAAPELAERRQRQVSVLRRPRHAYGSGSQRTSGPSRARASARMRQAPRTTSLPPPRGPSASFAAGSALRDGFLTWDSNAASSDCQMSASPPCSTR